MAQQFSDLRLRHEHHAPMGFCCQATALVEAVDEAGSLNVTLVTLVRIADGLGVTLAALSG